jgi:hypothetical protein
MTSSQGGTCKPIPLHWSRDRLCAEVFRYFLPLLPYSNPSLHLLAGLCHALSSFLFRLGSSCASQDTLPVHIFISFKLLSFVKKYPFNGSHPVEFSLSPHPYPSQASVIMRAPGTHFLRVFYANGCEMHKHRAVFELEVDHSSVCLASVASLSCLFLRLPR